MLSVGPCWTHLYPTLVESKLKVGAQGLALTSLTVCILMLVFGVSNGKDQTLNYSLLHSFLQKTVMERLLCRTQSSRAATRQ